MRHGGIFAVRMSVIFGFCSACKTACDVDDEVEVEQISGTNRALKKMKTVFLGPIGLNIRLGCSLGRMRTRNGDATPTKVNQTDNCE